MGIYYSDEYKEYMIDSIEPPVNSEDLYPEYIAEEVEESIEKIKLIGSYKSFAFMTDNHYAPTMKVRLSRTLNAYRHICEKTDTAFLAIGGDHTNEGTKRHKLECLKSMKEELSGIDFFPVNGNHDDGSIWEQSYAKSDIDCNCLLPKEQYDVFYRHIGKIGGVGKDESLYYYYDDKEEKTRYIFIDTIDIPYEITGGKLKYRGQNDRGISNTQLNWIANVALKFDEPSWGVCFIGHVSPIKDGKMVHNLRVIHDLIVSYKKGEDFCREGKEKDFEYSVNADFSKRIRAEVIMYLYGHEHCDEQFLEDGINYVATANAAMHFYAPEHWERVDGTSSEILFDVITNDNSKKIVYFTRVGAGKDRIIRY